MRSIKNHYHSYVPIIKQTKMLTHILIIINYTIIYFLLNEQLVFIL